MATQKKDTRKVFTMERVEVNGTCIHFDGKLDQEKNILKIYRTYGDVTLIDEAIQNFCIDNKIDKALVKN